MGDFSADIYSNIRERRILHMEITAMPDIPALSMTMAQTDVLGKVGTGILSKTLDVASEDGAALTKMMELSVDPTVGANFDMSV